MNNLSLIALLPIILLVAGCNDDDDGGTTNNGPVVSLPVLNNGSYTVTVTGEDLTFGEAFYDSQGNSFVLLAEDDRTPSILMVVKTGGAVTRIPAAEQDRNISYAAASTGGFASLNLAALAGSYTALIADQVVEFTLASTGAITAGVSACKMSGRLDATQSFAQAISASVSFTGCAGISGSYQGIGFVRTDMPPAAFRLVAHNGISVVDFLAF